MSIPKLIALLLVPAYVVLIAVLDALQIQAVFEPPLLLPVLNTLFLGIVPVAVAHVAGRVYLRTGSSSILLTGCGMLTFGICTISAGWLIGMPGGANMTVTVHNTGALVGAFFLALGSILNLVVKASLDQRGTGKRMIATAYGCVCIFVVIYTFATVKGLVPSFFIQGVGPTVLRQAVVAAAVILLALSSAFSMHTYAQWKSDFLYWYSLGLALVAIGLCAVFLQNAVGSPIGWLGRSAQYFGGVFTLVAVVTAWRSAISKGLPIEKVIANFLADAEASYRDLVESVRDAIMSFDQEGRIIGWNSAAEAMFGHTKGDAIGSLFFDLLIPEHHASVVKAEIEALLAQPKKSLSAKSVEAEGKRRDSSLFPVELSVSARELPVGRVTTCIIRDVTKRAQAAKELRTREETLRAILAASPVGIVLTQDRRIKWANNSWANMFGYESESDYLGQPTSIIHISQDSYEQIRKSLYEDHKPGAVSEVDSSLKRKDGTVFEGRIRINLVDSANPAKGTISAIADITEQKKAEASLREAEFRYRSLFDNMSDAVAVYQTVGDGEDFVFVDFNTSAEQTDRVSKQELLGRSVLKVFPGVREFGLFQVFQRVWRTGVPEHHPVGLYKDERLEGWRENFVYKLPSGEIVAVYSDESEREKAKQTLDAEKKRFQALAESSPFGMAMISQDGSFEYANPKFHEMFGYDLSEIPTGREWFRKAFPEPDYRHEVIAAWLEDLEKATPDQLRPRIFRVMRKDGTQKIIHFRPVLLPSGEHMVTYEDITHRQAAEEALRQSEEKYRNIFDNSIEGIFQSSPEGRLISVNSAYARMFGYGNPEEMVREVTDIASQLYANPADRGEVTRDFEDSFALESYEIQCRRKDGTHFWVSMNARSERDEGGRILYYEGMTEDITARKETEEALRKGEDLLTEAQRVAHIGHWEIDSPTGTPTWSEEIFHIFGLDPAQGEPSFAAHQNLIHPEDWNLLHGAVTRGTTEGIPFDIEFRSIRPDKSIRWINAKGYPTGKRQGEFFGMFGTAQDITERNLAQEALRESEEQFRAVFDNAGVGIDLLDPDGRIIQVNPCWLDMFGYTEEELRQLTFLDFTHPDDREISKRNLEALMAREIDSYTLEKRYLRKDGSILWGNLSTSALRDADGKHTGTVGVIEDITERKQAELALKASEIRYRRLFEAAKDGILILDADTGQIVDVNPYLTDLLGYTSEELCEKKLWEIGLFEDIAKSRAVFAQLQSKEYVRYEDLSLMTIGGDVINVEFVSNVYLVNGTKVIQCNIRDITERKRAEQALRDSEERFRHVSSVISDIAYSCRKPPTASYLIDWVTGMVERLTGYSVEEIKALKCWRALVVDEDLPIFDNQVVGLAPGASGSCELRLRAKTGGTIWVNSFAECERDLESPDSLLLYGGLMDITARKLSQQELREKEEEYRSLFEDSIDGIFITNVDGTLIDANQAFLDLFDYQREELIGASILKTYVDPADRTAYRNEIERRGSVRDYPLRMRRKDGTKMDCAITGTVRRTKDGTLLGYRGIIRDLTQEKNLQRQLQQAQKMEAIGTLAAGVAHDFNNLLTVVMGFSELLLAEKDRKHKEYPDLQKIFHAAKSGADLVQRLLMFSRKSDPKPTPMNLNKQIVQVEKLLRRTIPKMVDISLDLSPDLPAINADKSQVEQVLMNLAVNARDAMPDVGKLTVRTSVVTLDEEYCRLHLEATPGEYVLLEVADTGHGIDQETIGHIFEPFFTTKEVGRGTGLGLATVYGIVKQHNGHITVYSEVGKGTTFRVYLPTIPSDVEPELEDSGIMPAFGTETVLLVDDEELVRELGARILTKQGYTVLQAENGRQALSVFKSKRSQISLVILDLIMPVMGGTECLEELLRIDPRVNVLLASGFSADASVKESIEMSAKGFVSKPFRVRELLRDVRKVLDEG